MTSWPLVRTGEILVDGAWQPVTMREDPVVTVARGITSEGSRAKPGKCAVTLDNRDGRYSPRNPNSPLFGKIGRNTEFRLRVGDLPDTPDPDFTDTFDRTETDGWGTSDSAHDWVIYDPFGDSPPASDYSVDDGTGRMTIDSTGTSRLIRAAGVTVTDFDATYSVMTESAAEGDNTRSAVFAVLIARIDTDTDSWYGFNVGFRTDSGLPDGQGRRVAVSIGRYDDAETAFSSGTPAQSVPGLVYEPDVTLRVRVQGAGPELRMRVWAEDDREPDVWHSQFYDETYTSGGIGFWSVLSVSGADSTTVPFDVHYGDVEVAGLAEDTGVIRMRGEIPAWPVRRIDESGGDVVTDIKPAGILRRLGIGQRPVHSTLRRHVPLVRPLAYWPMEEGRQGEDQVADASVGENAGPMRISGFDFAKDSDLIGSDPLPKLIGGDQNVDFMYSGQIPGEETGSWSIEMLFRISEQDFPDGSDEKTMLAFYTQGSGAQRYIVSLFTSSGNPTMKVTVRDADGTELDSATASHNGAIAGGGPPLLEEWRTFRIRATEDGSDLDWRFDWFTIDASANWGNGGTISSTSAGRVSQITTTFGSEAAEDNSLKGLALGHLSVWGVQFHTGFQDGNFTSANGLRGQITRAFLRRLHIDENIPLEINGPAATSLGPYPPGTFLDTVHKAATTQMGIFSEKRSEPVLQYTAREELYNQTPALTLVYRNGEVFAPFDPTDDDKDVRNRIEVKRREGSRVVRELEAGPLSVRTPPDGIGPAETSIETIVNSDAQLPDQAGWRLHLGTVDGVRVPKLKLKMANARLRPLVDDVLKIDVGSRIKVTGTPSQYGPDGFDLRVIGYTETFATGVWDITFTCVDASGWTVATVAEADGFEDEDGFTITDGGDEAWFRTEDEAHFGSWSLQSGAITGNQTSDAIVAVPDGAQTLTFWYKVSSEEAGEGFEGDRLTVHVDDSEVLRDQGEVDWTQSILDVTGAETVTFRYSKDTSTDTGDDAAWIDGVVFTPADDHPQHADTDHSELAAGITATAAEALVHTPGGYLGAAGFIVADDSLPATGWVTTGGLNITDEDDLPVDVRVGGETWTVTAIEDLAWDTFDRTAETDTWGTADSGHTWTQTGGAASDRSTDGSEGIITLQASPATPRLQRLGETITDCEIRVRVSVDQTASTASLLPAVLMRHDGSNFYRLRMHFTTGGNTFFSVARNSTMIGSNVQLPWTYAPDDQFEIRMRIKGQQIKGRAWPVGGVEPANWQIDRTVTTDPITAGDIGLAGSAFDGNDNVNPELHFDNFQVVTPQRWTVARSVNGIVKTHAAGADVRLAPPPIPAL
jgi:hypothetical protein